MLFNYQGNSYAKLCVSGEWESPVLSDGPFLVKVVWLWRKSASDCVGARFSRQQHHVRAIDVMTSSFTPEQLGFPAVPPCFRSVRGCSSKLCGRVTSTQVDEQSNAVWPNNRTCIRTRTLTFKRHLLPSLPYHFHFPICPHFIPHYQLPLHPGTFHPRPYLS